jgi:hypothetical protein
MEKTPKNNGEYYFEPAASEWRSSVLKNREKFFNMSLWGQTAAKVRTFFGMPIDCPIVLTGHQPVFFYPGIWAKCLAASQLAQSVAGIPYHLITDTALAPEFNHFVPEVDENGRVRRKQIDFFLTKDMKVKERTLPYAFLPAPEREALEKIFLDSISYGPSSVKRSTQYFSRKLLSGLKDGNNWNQFHSHALDLLDRITGDKLEKLEGTRIWTSEPFVDFFVYWLTNMAELNKTYNDSLDEYRKKNGITHEIEPMPNLKFEDWYFEMPFWGTAHAHSRGTIWAKMDHKDLILKVKGVEGHHQFHLNNLKNELVVSPFKIWPKALPQTLFLRMYLCDFFIHGIGGSVYEEVGNIFFKKITMVDPPAYGVVSATYWVDFKENDESNVILDYQKVLETWKRALEHNPEYVFTRESDWKRDLPGFLHSRFEHCLKNEGLKMLADEKKGFIDALKDPAKRAEAAERIKEINAELQQGCSEVMRAIEKGLFDVQTVKERQDVLTFREYPFFCFEEPVFHEMKEKIRQALV